jgi:hypothetical protein
MRCILRVTSVILHRKINVDNSAVNEKVIRDDVYSEGYKYKCNA